ncbi:DUF6174 domain-containing protein [Jidongwangia harbinensis]|uniref:DUF6174 domain-containing protein n=1 Tax=Jidongwangia harbinensis TaxID=2878561 RepID=UPI001CDA4F53|nr:DUF6174 domain-containing protein [Jidongwangia harbinensis]MCA2214399.1 DUF6174 domain-containing protein [Jidongwangia harbinensis]
MRLRGVLFGAILAVAATGCADRPGATAGAEPAASPPVWSEPSDYKFTFESSCGERALIGRFQVAVAGHKVARTEGLDDAGRRALMLRIANLVPTLGQMEDQAERARADGADQVTVDRDPADGHPTAIRIDASTGAVDDETCYTIADYTIGGKPGSFPSSPR